MSRKWSSVLCFSKEISPEWYRWYLQHPSGAWTPKLGIQTLQDQRNIMESSSSLLGWPWVNDIITGHWFLNILTSFKHDSRSKDDEATVDDVSDDLRHPANETYHLRLITIRQVLPRHVSHHYYNDYSILSQSCCCVASGKIALD